MTHLQIRKIPFDFDGDVPFVWNRTNPEFAIMCNAISVLAIAFEKYIVTSLPNAMSLITDPDVREEAEVFMRQEGQHSRMHRAHVAALIRRYPGVQRTLDEAVAAFDDLLRTRSIEFHLAYTASLEATFTPIFKLFLDHHRTLYAPGDDRVASLFLWHFVEEVEHRSSAMVIYRHVVGRERTRMRMVPEIFRHVVGVYGGAVRSFATVIPPEDQVIDPTRAAPSRMYRREIAVRLPGMRHRVVDDGHGTALQCASAGEMLRMAVGLVRSQMPGHDPTHQPLPEFADDWMAAYDRGVDVSTWYASRTAELEDAAATATEPA